MAPIQSLADLLQALEDSEPSFVTAFAIDATNRLAADWPCVTCTFVNPGSINECQMCEEPREVFGSCNSRGIKQEITEEHDDGMAIDTGQPPTTPAEDLDAVTDGVEHMEVSRRCSLPSISTPVSRAPGARSLVESQCSVSDDDSDSPVCSSNDVRHNDRDWHSMHTSDMSDNQALETAGADAPYVDQPDSFATALTSVPGLHDCRVHKFAGFRLLVHSSVCEKPCAIGEYRCLRCRCGLAVEQRREYDILVQRAQ